MTIVCDTPAHANDHTANRIRASLHKLEDVIEVDDIGRAPSVTRELALIKVAATSATRSQIFELVEVFRARIVDLAPDSLMIEITGVESKIEGLIQVLNETETRVLEVCRSGKMTMRRGQHTKGVLRAMGAVSDPEAQQIGSTLQPSSAAETFPDSIHDNFADNI
jgi:acetolactate synthase-1/3 small subunit